MLVRLQAHNQHAVMGKGYPLHRSWGAGRCRAESKGVICGLSRRGEGVFLLSKNHGSLRTEADVDDARASDNIYRLVAMLGDVVSSTLVELNQNMVERSVGRW